MENKKRVKMKVAGDVQGVSYRYFARDIARKMGIVGVIENNPDGSVELIVEGDEERVDEFVSWCKQGSPMSTVQDVKVTEEKYSGDFKDFQIK